MKFVGFSIWSLLVLALFFPLRATLAQEGATPEPTPAAAVGPQIHIVQDGENLTIIAEQYGVSVQDLLLVNGLDETALIQPGQQLTIPGASGDLVVTTYRVQVGDTLEGLAARFNTSVAELAADNHVLNSHNLYAGQQLSVISHTGSAEPQPVTGTVHLVQPGETLLTIAARYLLAPQQIVESNDLSAAYVYPGMRLRLPLALPEPDAYQYLPGGWQRIAVGPTPIVQGETVSIYVEHATPGEPGGTFAGQTLHFAPYADGFVALVGLDAFTEPGRYPLEIFGSGEGPWWPFRQQVQVTNAGYPTQTINIPAELAPLLAPEVRAEEDAFLSTIYSQFTPAPRWEGAFTEPVSNTIVTAPYGGARSYNGGPFEIFHTGVDFGGTVGTPIRAPAAGTVIFSDTLELRGNTLIIDHGLGVMSGYYHLSEIRVNVGDNVSAGQTVALGGNTGLSTGPHLHWELRVMDVPVNGLQWTGIIFPQLE